MTGVVKVKGTPVELGGTVYIVPPLSLGAVEQLQDRISAFSGDLADMSQVGLVIDVAHASLKRNYPEMTRDQVADIVDLGDMAKVFEAVMAVSGLVKRVDEVSEAASGE